MYFQKERQLFIVDPINKNIDTYQQKDCDPINKNIDTPINKKIEDNNININNIIEYNYIYKSEKFQKTFLDFLEMRKKIKKPATDKAIQLLLSKLEKVKDEEKAIQMLENSILNNWQDIYLPREERNVSTNNSGDVKKSRYEESTYDRLKRQKGLL